MFRKLPLLPVLCLAAGLLQGAPPEVPAKMPAKTGKPIIFDVKTEPGKPFSWAPGFDKSKCAIVRLYTEDDTVAQFMAIPDVDGTYYLTFWTRGDKEKGYSQLVIEATGGGGGVVPPINPPIDPPPTPGRSLYFLIVRADGPADPAFTRVAAMSEWNTLKSQGHRYKDKTVTEAAKLGVEIPAGMTLPVVVILRDRADGKSSEQVKTVPLPASGVGILALPAFVN